MESSPKTLGEIYLKNKDIIKDLIITSSNNNEQIITLEKIYNEHIKCLYDYTILNSDIIKIITKYINDDIIKARITKNARQAEWISGEYEGTLFMIYGYKLVILLKNVVINYNIYNFSCTYLFSMELNNINYRKYKKCSVHYNATDNTILEYKRIKQKKDNEIMYYRYTYDNLSDFLK